jgi:hypothetical protein
VFTDQVEVQVYSIQFSLEAVKALEAAVAAQSMPAAAVEAVETATLS